MPFLSLAQPKDIQITSDDIQLFKHHVIVLIDRSGSIGRKMNSTIGAASIEALITEELPTLLYETGEVLENRALLEKKDYLSIGFFGLGDVNNYDYKNFITQKVTKSDLNELGLSYKQHKSTATFKNLWNSINRNKAELFSGNFTGLSFTGPMGFHFFKQQEIKVHRTFVIIITDGQFNSIDDPSSELRHKTVTGRNGITHKLLNLNFVDNVYSEVKSNYIWHPELLRREVHPFELSLLEYKTNQSSLSVRSKLDFPVSIQMDKMPTGYEKSIKIKDIHPSDSYVPNKVLMQIYPSATDSTNLISQKLIHFKDGIAELLIKDLPPTYTEKTLFLKLSFWLDFNDEAYGAHQLHPFGETTQGAVGLVEQIDLTFEKRSRVLGIIPMSDSMHSMTAALVGTGQKDNARLWNVLFILVMLLAAIIFTRRYIVKRRAITDPNNIIIQTSNGLKIN